MVWLSWWAPLSRCTLLKFNTSWGLMTNGATLGHLRPLWREDIRAQWQSVKHMQSFLPCLSLTVFLLYFLFLTFPALYTYFFLPFLSLLTPFLSLFLLLRPHFHLSRPSVLPVLSGMSCSHIQVPVFSDFSHSLFPNRKAEPLQSPHFPESSNCLILRLRWV